MSDVKARHMKGGGGSTPHQYSTPSDAKGPKIITQIQSRIVDRVAVDQLHPMVYVEEKIESIDIPDKVRMRFEVSLRSDSVCPTHMATEARKVFVEQVRHYVYAELIEDLLSLRRIACEEGSQRVLEKTREILAYVEGI